LSVRGPLSAQLLQDLGLSHVEVIGDPALGLTPDTPPPFRSRQRLIVNLAHESPPSPQSAEYAMCRQVAKIANDFAGKGGEIVGVALGPKDRAALERFRRDHQVPRLRIEDHRTSARGLLDTLAGSTGLIGVRLHSAVLACCVGVPSILFSYRDKCRDFMMSMDLEDFAVEVSDQGPARVSQCFERLQSQADPGPEIYRKAVSWKRQQHAFYARLARSIAEI
jgi:polysaccharide pyruvyl transferase WcaK-like protein